MTSSRQTRHAIWAQFDYRLHGKNTAMRKCTDNSQSRVGRCFFCLSVSFGIPKREQSARVSLIPLQKKPATWGRLIHL
jgi:predicted DCC family thiol-disulfide oxidoreductase YuxK